MILVNCVKSKTQVTSESWITSVLLVMNLAHWIRAGSFMHFLERIQGQIQRLFKNIREHNILGLTISAA